MWYLLFSVLLFLGSLCSCTGQSPPTIPKCGRAKDCGDCMGIGPPCSWCFDENYDDTKEGPGYRCASPSVLVERGCAAEKIEDVKSKVADDKGTFFDPEYGDIQLTPRHQSLKIRPNDPLVVNFTFQSISDYPVDLYFLTDLSYTMSDDLETVSNMTNDIVLTMRTVTKKLQMGFGAFVDKPVFPFVVPTPQYLQNPCLNVGTKELHCDPPFLYKHILSLTDNFEEFREKTKVTRPSGNLDSPEGGMDALLQVARCGDHIRWRANARKIVLFASDGGFHLAGDGRIAGLVRPPPTTCQLTEQADRFNSSLRYIAQVLTDKDISVIFAVDSKLHALYTKLAAFLPSAAVGVLSASSTNIVDLLRDNYAKIANKAELMTTYESDYLEVQVLSRCHGQTEFKKQTVCNEHPVGGRIDYQISVKPKRCFKGKKAVTLKMLALDDQATLEVETACDCPTCDQLPRPDYSGALSPRCQSRGYLHCGSCQCQPGYSGDFCECSAEATEAGESALIAQCTAPGDKEPCSGRGRCTCGKCKCNLARYEGPYCECDRHGCRRASDDNQVCGGPQRGTCNCDGTCVCKPGYTGDRCDCMESEKQCIDPNNPTGPKCSGHGVCDCGQCFCNSGYTGHLCNEIQGGESALCTDRDVEKCVLCLRDSLIKSFEERESHSTKQTAITSTAGSVPRQTTIISGGSENELIILDPAVYTSPEYAQAATSCSVSCNGTVIDTTRVKLVDSSEQKDDSNLCIIYTDDNCRVFFTYRYSDAIYLNRKVDLNIIRKSECVETINILYIVLGVIAGIVVGGLILLLIYKLVITIDDRRELAKFEQQGQNMRWEMAENPIFESPTTKVINPTYEETGY
ncbi:Integrin beta [Fasciola gigantica]|uniref:Integrin beta n=1 Tax=Fasciola gigantica TaxID=46835 RepID=A0A504YHG2_FASGI|nr:Integrin beta [Fasciola gigantica]